MLTMSRFPCTSLSRSGVRAPGHIAHDHKPDRLALGPYLIRPNPSRHWPIHTLPTRACFGPQTSGTAGFSNGGVLYEADREKGTEPSH